MTEEEEAQAAFMAAMHTAAAPFVNRVHVGFYGDNIRISFGEQYDERVQPNGRAAVMVHLSVAQDLVEILTRLLAQHLGPAPTELSTFDNAVSDRPAPLPSGGLLGGLGGALDQVLNPKKHG